MQGKALESKSSIIQSNRSVVLIGQSVALSYNLLRPILHAMMSLPASQHISSLYIEANIALYILPKDTAV